MLRCIFGFCLGAAIRVCDHDFELYDDLSWFYLSEKYFGEEEGQQDVTLQERTEELLRIYNDIVSHCNALSMEIERDDSGAVVYSGGLDSKGNAVDMAGKAIGAMQNLGKSYAQLDGYYPRPKAMFFSDFMCQMYMCGYYFPFPWKQIIMMLCLS